MGSVAINLAPGFQREESAFTWEIPAPVCLADLLEDWGSRCAPELLGRLFDREAGGIAASILILVNGRSVKSEDPRATMVSPGDSVLIAPVLLGG